MHKVILAACSDRDPGGELGSLTLDRPLATLELVREARGSAEGGNDL